MAQIKRAIAMGFFDGVHLGHAALLNKTKERAEECGMIPAVLSFDVHPDTLVFGRDVPLINSASGREELIRRLFGINDVVFIHFNRSLMHMPWDQFIESFVSEMDIGHIVVGYDFSFGDKGLGNPEKLTEWCREHGVGCDVIPAVTVGGKIVSSSRIRELIQAGDMEEANLLLGHPHILTDTVRAGYHLGTKMGTPTINMYFGYGVLVPRYGVYATKVVLEDGSKCSAVTNVGVRPTVGGDNRVNVESHLLDYSGNLYNHRVRVEFFKFLRPETRFDSLESLFEQIKIDTENARAYFEGNAG